MPLYRYKCNNCGHDFTRLRKIKERRESIPCPECDIIDEHKLVFGKHNRGFVLEPQYFEHLDTEPVWIEGKKHLKEECEKRGLEAKCLYD